MQKTLTCLFIVLFVLFPKLSNAQGVPVGKTLLNEINSKTLTPYFMALKSGDIFTIKQHIAGDMYKNSKVLLEKNKNYPQFLRDIYKGATFRTSEAVVSDGDVIAHVEIAFPNGNRSLARLRLSKMKNISQSDHESETWKIVELVGE